MHFCCPQWEKLIVSLRWLWRWPYVSVLCWSCCMQITRKGILSVYRLLTGINTWGEGFTLVIYSYIKYGAVSVSTKPGLKKRLTEMRLPPKDQRDVPSVHRRSVLSSEGQWTCLLITKWSNLLHCGYSYLTSNWFPECRSFSLKTNTVLWMHRTEQIVSVFSTRKYFNQNIHLFSTTTALCYCSPGVFNQPLPFIDTTITEPPAPSHFDTLKLYTEQYFKYCYSYEGNQFINHEISSPWQN